MRVAFLPVIWLAFVGVLMSGCVQKMGTEGHRHPYVQPRLEPPGTVAVGKLRSPLDDEKLQKNPLQLTLATLKRGQERFNIYCAPCHGDSGYADGVIVQRGFPKPPSFHSDRLRHVSDGYIYGVISHGFGVMYSYSDRVSVDDRWAIVSYVRALQLSQNADLARLSAADRAALERIHP